MIDIRDLRAEDVAAIPAVPGGPAWHGGPDKWSSYWQDHQSGRRRCLVAEADGAIAGYASLVWMSGYEPLRTAGFPEIQDLVVAQSYRRLGIARMLVSACEQRAREAGSSGIGIGFGLYADYGPAQRLYVKLGYLPDGRGVTWNYVPVAGGATVEIDDDLVLWLTKSFERPGSE